MIGESELHNEGVEKETNPPKDLEVGVVVPNRNRDYDFQLTTRFLNSLRDSDFPHNYLLYSPIGWKWDSRERGFQEMLKAGKLSTF